MDLNYWFCVIVIIATLLVSGSHCRITEADSFDVSSEESFNLSPELRNALKPAEDAFLGFINKLVKTGYASSKIALKRIEKATEKRRQFGDQLENFLTKLPSYSSDSEVSLPTDDKASRMPQK